VHFLIFCVLHGVSKHSHNDHLFGLMKVKWSASVDVQATHETKCTHLKMGTVFNYYHINKWGR